MEDEKNISDDEDLPDDDYLNLSDEDFDKLSGPAPASSIGSEEEKDIEDEKEEEISEEKDLLTADPVEDDKPKEKEEDTDDSDDNKPVESDEDKQVKVEDEPIKEDKTDKKEPVITDTDKVSVIDYKAEYEKLMAPFKANGQEMTLKNVEDAKRLQQMGANYHKKMAGMKPALKALKTLENNDLLDESKLNFLIDLHQGKQDAITQLLKEKKIDPLDVDTKTETPYTPANHVASDVEVALDSVLNNIEQSPNYNKTLTTVTKEWDNASKTEAANNPQIISVINEHMDSGIYDKVMSAVQYDRSMGKFTNVSDLEAYKQTGNRLEQEGKLLTPVTSLKNTDKQKTSVTDPDKEKKRKEKKKAASPTKASKKVSKIAADFNPLNLSDEAFEKFDKKTIGL